MQGRLGIELARQHQPDLILLDLHLPDIMGDEVLACLKGDRGHPPHPRSAMLTADATPALQTRLLAAGADHF
jgi:CheY-like chemotaxis protein